MSIQLKIVDPQGNPIEHLDDLVLTLYADGHPLAQGVHEGRGLVRFAASIEGIKALSVRAEWKAVMSKNLSGVSQRA